MSEDGFCGVEIPPFEYREPGIAEDASNLGGLKLSCLFDFLYVRRELELEAITAILLEKVVRR